MAIRDEYKDTNWHAALDAFIEHSPRMESVTSLDVEAERERDWDDVIESMRFFAEERKHGWPAVCRALGEAMNPQRRIFRG